MYSLLFFNISIHLNILYVYKTLQALLYLTTPKENTILSLCMYVCEALQRI